MVVLYDLHPRAYRHAISKCYSLVDVPDDGSMYLIHVYDGAPIDATMRFGWMVPGTFNNDGECLPEFMPPAVAATLPEL